MSEIEFSYRTRGHALPENKPKVFFTCHPDDFSLYFDSVCRDILDLQDCAIFYTENMNQELADPNIHIDLERMNLFVIPVTYKLLSTGNRTMSFDFSFAKRKHIPVLPLLMESDIVEFYSQPNNFGDLQYIKPNDSDITAIDYKDKLKKYLESVLVSNELAQRIRNAFDAYIFLSYRKKDRKYANELMKMIHRNPECEDTAIWFDEFLTPGESFRENIKRILSDSKLVALLVTPSLLERHSDGSPNFIMKEEYPAAKNMGKPILPAEMENTDIDALKREYAEIPECANTNDEEEFRQRLLDSLVGIAVSENNDEPEHNYLIGLAYIKGIDVEIDVDRGVKLITKAAESGLVEAMEKLYNMYFSGDSVQYDYGLAASWMKRLYELSVETLGPEDPSTISYLNLLAYASYLNGDYAEAIRFSELCCELSAKIYGDEALETVNALNTLAIIYLETGKTYDSLIINEKCFEIRKAVLGETNKDTLISMINLAHSYYGFANYYKMLELSERCFELFEKTCGLETEFSLHAMNDMGVAYLWVGYIESSSEKYKKALDIHLRCYELTRKVCGENSPLAVTVLCNIAEDFKYLKDYQNSLKSSLDCYKLCRKVYGSEHPRNITKMKSLSSIYGLTGDLVNCLDFAIKCYELCCDIYGNEDIHTLNVMVNLAEAYGRSHKNYKRLNISKQCYKTSKKKYGETYNLTLCAMYQMACAYGRIGRIFTSVFYHCWGFVLTMKQFSENRRDIYRNPKA